MRKRLLFDILLLYRLVFIYDSKLPIVLFCRTALLGFAILCDNVAAMCEGKNQREQVEGLAASGAKRNARVLAKTRLSPIPCPLGFPQNQLLLLSDERSGSIAFAMLSHAPSFLTHTLTPLGCWLNSDNHPNIVYPVSSGTLNATRPQF